MDAESRQEISTTTATYLKSMIFKSYITERLYCINDKYRRVMTVHSAHSRYMVSRFDVFVTYDFYIS